MFVTIILDGVGIGEAPDAVTYGDEGSDTLGHVAHLERPHLPHLAQLGLGNIRSLQGISPASHPEASYGKMAERSSGKDSTTGHWEFAGIILDEPLPTYPEGFPEDVVARFCSLIGVERVLGNRPESGTVIMDECGEEHLLTGLPILYTSADSVFQIAAHVDVVPLETLYTWCKIARDQICVGPHGVGRVIARPFGGELGQFNRLSTKRKDFSRLPHEKTLQEALQSNGVKTVSVGKVADLFGVVGFDELNKTGANSIGIAQTIACMRAAAGSGEPTFIWTNLIDFDQEFGHRNNPSGFAKSLEEFDQALPSILEALPPGSRLLISADHGNDPTTPGSDHSREFVPLLYYGGEGAENLGIRATFADHAATVATFFDVDFPSIGLSFEPSR
ncbi:phosphopentomutase [bacterium]|nr:phosphopentomutase [bacterium]